ncbi:MAG: amylo-alpha-1,6-glucosidase, partial [Thermodesulfobacteriota bacterium]
ESPAEPKRIENQRLHAKVIDVFRHYHGVADISGFSVPEAVEELRRDPVDFCRSMGSLVQETRVIRWEYPRDIRREVMVPPNHFLLIRAENPFRAQIVKANRVIRWEESLPDIRGIHFALIVPVIPPKRLTRFELKLLLHQSEKGSHVQAPLLFLSGLNSQIKPVFMAKDLESTPLYYLSTNGSGSMLRQPVDWGKLTSRYDAVLAANFNRKGPSDRWIMVARYRAWVVYEDYSQEVNSSCLESFSLDDHRRGIWRFKIPTGRGKQIRLHIALSMREKETVSEMSILRESGENEKKMLEDHHPVRIILRPDIEDRSAHEVTKAYLGPEHHWKQMIVPAPGGFSFRPQADRELRISVTRGEYVHEPEWNYMIFRPQESQRGQDPNSDLFSPGYFSTLLQGREETLVTAEAIQGEYGRSIALASGPRFEKNRSGFSGRKKDEFLEQSSGAMSQYITEREGHKTVLAGYPWFLDWGRDSLIFARGLIALNRIDTACSILKQFGRFESKGTLPNMIGEKGPSNWDTSDAPLWFCVVCGEVLRTRGYERFIDEPCGSRTIREILFSIVDSMIQGTANGIAMDPSSGLIFSPAHFTWMDTNFPAGTPRQGFPVEIQALWDRSLRIVGPLSSSGKKDFYRELSRRVRKKIVDLYFLEETGYMSDCLFARPGERAMDAEKDDALRPNQLMAITMGAVKDHGIAKKMIFACEELLVPGAVRSLADRPLNRPLEIIHHDRRLADPKRPYKGRYEGDEDTERKPAYHNGTAWTWLFPVFCEAYSMVFGEEGKETARAYLG